MDGTIVKLSKPVKAFERTFTELTLREPTGKLFARLGEPRIPVINNSAGSGYWVDRDETISQYLDTLLDIDDAAMKPIILSALSLADMISMRKALFDFFLQGAEMAAAMQRTPSPSA